MKILLAASEVSPIIQMGGLGDVVGSLPKALEKLGVNVDVIVPYFPFANTKDIQLYKSLEIDVPFAGETNVVSVYNTFLPGSHVNVSLLQNNAHFHNYGKTWKLSNEDEVELFSFFDRAVVEYIKSKFNTYDLIHCNDWHTGLITHLLEDELSESRPATLFTIHNLMYQGIGDLNVVRDVGIVPGEHMLIDWDSTDDHLNMIEQGLASADFISTVSPTYMEEILTPEFGGDLSDILKVRSWRTAGILNGLDYTAFPRNYDENNFKPAKNKLKKELLAKLGLTFDINKPLFAFIGRLDPYQKGIDLVYEAIPYIVKNGGQFVLLGTGDTTWESKFTALAKESDYSHDISANITFDKLFSEQIYAAADFLLVPSRYEPCGLIQMIAMWYGTLPIVRATGGLKDSVKEGINGFLFDMYTAQDLINAVTKAFNSFNGHTTDPLIKAAMTADFSWDKSAISYNELYKKVIQFRKDSI